MADFAEQVDTLIRCGYPELVGVSEPEFLRIVEPLGDRLPDAPFALVVPGAPAHRAIERVAGGFTTMEPEDLGRFRPTEDVSMPSSGGAYLLVEPDTGAETLNVTPDDALDAIVAQGRSPLTIDDGLALVAHDPRILRERNCFSLLGSRCGDRRVTALWVSRGRPRLGWCWAGNPHTWLGSASCAGRIGAE